MKLFIATLIFLLTCSYVSAQVLSFPFSAQVTVDDEHKQKFKQDGRLFLFLSKNPNAEPRTQTWPIPGVKTYIFARNIEGHNSANNIVISNDQVWNTTADWSLDEVPAGEYYIQVLWDQDTEESRMDAPGNFYSETQKVNIDKSIVIFIDLNKSIADREVMQHELSREVTMKSELLSSWWDKPMDIKASVLLPRKYDNKKKYPIRYNVAGYGGRYDRINELIGNDTFMKWWESDDAPEIINVFLDGDGPYGDSYQMDSENSGPYGESLIKELIPYIENLYRGTSEAATRFVDGCSTGGWSSLGLQLYYPDHFNGVFSYSPDAIEFENYQLINIYQDKNAYVNEYGYERPAMRGIDGEPMVSLKDFVRYENIQGPSDTYVTSGEQFSAHTALYSPRGADGLPQPLFDPLTGVIDADVANHWKKYDFKLYAEENWQELGPKLAGKIYIWMGDMDQYYLNAATRSFANFMENTTNPKSDAIISFTPMSGHCTEYSDIDVLNKMQTRLDNMEK